jgi:hypothetical protein
MSDAAETTPSVSRPRRWLRVLGVLAGLCVLLLAVLAWSLTHLESAPFKRRIMDAAASYGIALDYDALSVTPGGVRLRGLRVLQPAPDSGPPLIAIDELDLRVHPLRTIARRRASLALSSISGVHITLNQDEDGSSSITRLLKAMPPGPPKPATAPKPLSEMFGILDDLPIDLESFQLKDVDATVVRRSKSGVVTTHYSGLELASSAGPGALALAVGTPPAGGQLDINGPQGHQQLAADAHLKLGWGSQRGEISFDASLRRQDLFTLPGHAPPVEQLASLHATLVPTPGKHKSIVTIDRVQLLGKAGDGSAIVELLDGPRGAITPFIQQASLNLTLDGLHGFLPEDFGVLQELSGHVTAKISGVEIDGTVPKVGAEGGADVEADIARAAWNQAPNRAEVTKLDLKARLRPALDGFDAETTLHVGSARAEAGTQKAVLGHSRIEARLHVTGAQQITGTISALLERTELSGEPALSLKDAELKVDVKDGALVDHGLIPVRGSIAAELTTHELSAEHRGLHVAASSLKLHAPLRLDPARESAAETRLDATDLEVRQHDRVLLPSTGLSFLFHAPKFALDAASPIRSTGAATVDLTMGAITAQARVDKRVRDLDYELSTRLPSLALARPFVPATLPVPWDKVHVTIASKGSVLNVAAGLRAQLSEDTTIQIENGAFHGKPVDLATDVLKTHVVSHGTLSEHTVDATMQLAGIVLQQQPLTGDENATLHLVLDRNQPSAELHFQLDGTACPAGHLDLTTSYDRAQRRLTYKTEGKIHHLDLIATFLPDSPADSLDWTALSLGFRGAGNMDDLITGFHGDAPILAADPRRATRGTQHLDITVNELHYADDDDQTVDLGSLNLNVDAEEKEDGIHATASVGFPKGEVDASDVVSKLDGLRQALTVDLLEQSVSARLHLDLAALSQTAYSPYPVGDLSLDVVANASADGTLHLETFKLDNRAGGVSVTASGTVESAVFFKDGLPHLKPFAGAQKDRRGVQIMGELTQRLESLPTAAGVKGQGVARVPFQVESGDFRILKSTTGITFEHANLELPERGIALTNLNAHVPIQLKIRLTEHGLALLGGARPGLYSRARFADYQPFLGQENYVTLDSLRLGNQVVGPIAGNLRMDRNLLALDQMEMAAYGGKVTGQLIIDVDVDSRELEDVRFRGNVAGLAPSVGGVRLSDVVDANAALRLDPHSLSLEGRIEVVRIGREDLEAMLDTWDPNRAEITANRARAAIHVGYPKDVRLEFHEGFTVIKIVLGGVAGAAPIDPIQLPTGPLMEKYVVPQLNRLKGKGTR